MFHAEPSSHMLAFITISTGLLTLLYFPWDCWGLLLPCPFTASSLAPEQLPHPVLESQTFHLRPWDLWALQGPTGLTVSPMLSADMPPIQQGRFSWQQNQLPLFSPQTNGFQSWQPTGFFKKSNHILPQETGVSSLFQQTCLPYTLLLHSIPLSATSMRSCVALSVLPWLWVSVSNSVVSLYPRVSPVDTWN